MGRKLVNQEDLMSSIDTVIAGAEKKNAVLTETEKRLVAYHEVGHALVSTLEKRSMPVSKITIVPHTEGALGYTMYLPDEEKYLSTRMSCWLSCGAFWAAVLPSRWYLVYRPTVLPTISSRPLPWPATWYPSTA